MNEQLQSLDQITTTAIDLAVKFAPKALVAVLILAAGFYAGPAQAAGRGSLSPARHCPL